MQVGARVLDGVRAVNGCCREDKAPAAAEQADVYKRPAARFHLVHARVERRDFARLALRRGAEAASSTTVVTNSSEGGAFPEGAVAAVVIDFNTFSS